MVAPAAVGGGDISAAWRVTTDGGAVFIKTAPAGANDMFAAEAAGLRELAAAKALRVPQVLVQRCSAETAWLVTEWLSLEATSADVERRLGTQLAAMHRCQRKRHGWVRDNTIGLTPQLNSQSDDWISFYRNQRLRYQLELAEQNGYSGELKKLGGRLLDRLDSFFQQPPTPSLLHGDLWAGNWAACDGEPVIYDPAVYYGDRETDLAMTHLFGGFSPSFYVAYESSWPLPEGHERRRPLYQLYHVLNHLNLFGPAYHARSIELLRTLL